jgi:aryl-alcohol dehydrogenase-like predicted oxidoreductase
MSMIHRKLGASGIEISAVGFGSWAIGGWMWGGADEQEAIGAIHAAIDHGITLIDTAPVYGFGRSEKIVAQAIRGRRDKIVLATKCGLVWDREEGEFHFNANQEGITSQPSELKVFKFLRPESIVEEVERSLQRLETDYIDLYQTHWQEATTPIADTMAALLKLKDQGKIRAIGVSNANVDQMKAYGPIDSDQERFSMLDRAMETNGSLEYCRKENIAVLAYSPLANGLLTGNLSPDRTFNPGDLRRDNPRFSPENIRRVNAILGQWQPIAERHNATLGQIAIAWTFAQPGLTCVLCGARNAKQAIENAAAGKIQLSAEELQAIDKTLTALLTK